MSIGNNCRKPGRPEKEKNNRLGCFSHETEFLMVFQQEWMVFTELMD
jgi:hypothetical protein